jgi:uncharacterized protein
VTEETDRPAPPRRVPPPYVGRSRPRPLRVPPTSGAAVGRKAVLVAAVVASLLNSDALMRAAQAMPPGFYRDLTLKVAAPLRQVSHATGLQQAHDLAFGWLNPNPAEATGDAPSLTGPEPAQGARLPPPAAVPAPSPSLPAPAPAPAAPLLRPSAARPLRLLVTGDSLTGYLGPLLATDLQRSGLVRTYVDTHNGTGIAKPYFVDWAALAAQQVRQYHPDVVVVFLGANDFVGMQLPGGGVAAEGSPGWEAEYQRRVQVVMSTYAQGRASRVYWLSLPTAESEQKSRDYTLINAAIRAAAPTVPGAEVVDMAAVFTPGGRYRYTMPINGHQTVVRELDGIHLNRDGSQVGADLMAAELAHDFGLPAHS